MTNAEKYLKDKADARKLFLDFKRYCCKHNCYLETDEFVAFMQEQEKPTLAEDERVILRNIDETVFTHIGRDTKSSIYDLYLRGERTRCVEIDDILKPDLFTFIKERRRILN